MSFGHGTQNALQFVYELITHMITADIRSYHLPKVTVPLDLAYHPIKVAAYDKIIKVLDMKGRTDRRRRNAKTFIVRDEGTGQLYTFTMTWENKDRDIRIEMTPQG